MLGTFGWLLTVCFICLTFIPRSLDHVLFVDGLAYAAISRNMAMGLGSFWEPYFADSFWMNFNDRCAFFCEHPPLMFGLQAQLFKVLGDTTLVENLYNLIILLASVGVIALIWRELFKNNLEIKQQAWLPILMWYSLRVVWWSVPGNLLDTTMAVFCMLSFYFQLKAISETKFKPLYWILAGTMVLLAILTKGPVGLFPLAFPVIYMVVFGKRFYGIGVKGLLTTLASFGLLLTLLLMYEPALFFLKNYFQGQVMLAIMQKRERVAKDWTAHFYLLKILFVNIIPHLLFVAGFYFFRFYSKRSAPVSNHAMQVRMLVLLTALSGILPMMVSVKQADYYLMPALPFVGFFFAAWCVEMLLTFAGNFTSRIKVVFTGLSVILLAGMIFKLLHPDFDRTYEIAQALKKHVPERSKIYVTEDINTESGLHSTYQRYARLSVAFNPTETKYFFFNHQHKMLDSIAATQHFEIIDLVHGAKLGVKK
ncbi:ArnT family glycosyltransferase [Dyadobacter luticola]|uniref:Glycosyltransferase RgtA/B/C/D-like domain-containing protein n=1 Tax=Dyadobacter luticola TaxID=1979387 RepID=A0A5R9KQ70_9BACT|nr:glycosyltransferase family 39 protein [Dyadobacter luticola]TLU98236.1 hypothetical protein FEN17_26035 [Dyadobacter luticola]